MKEWLSHLELAKFAEIPESTSRRYINLFPNYFRTDVGIRGKKYHVEGARVLQRIQELYQDGYDTEKIEPELAKEFPRYIDEPQQETELIPKKEAVLASRDDILQALAQVGELYQEITEEMNRELESLREEVATAKTAALETQQENKKMREYIATSIEERDRALLETIRAIQKQTMEEIQAAPRKKRLWPFGRRNE